MPYALTYDEVKELGPCKSEFRRVSKLLGGKRKWNGRKVDASTARAEGCTLDDILWVAIAIARHDPDVGRRLRLWMADCASRVLHIYEKYEDSDVPRKAITAARQFARGEIDYDAMRTMRDTARPVANTPLGAQWYAAWAAGSAAGATVRDVKWAANAARYAASSVAWAAGDVAVPAEKSWQFTRLIERLSDNEPEDWKETNDGCR